jgi:hypothetical protein
MRKKRQPVPFTVCTPAACNREIRRDAIRHGPCSILAMQKKALAQTGHFSVLSVFAIMTKMKRPFINPPTDAAASALRCFNQ